MPETADALVKLGYQARRDGRVDDALHFYSDAAMLYRDLSDPQKLAHTVRHVGDILRKQGSIEKARPCYEEALTIYRAHHETSDLDLANTLRGFALLCEDAGEKEQAKNLWREARTLYDASNVLPGVQESEARIAKL